MFYLLYLGIYIFFAKVLRLYFLLSSANSEIALCSVFQIPRYSLQVKNSLHAFVTFAKMSERKISFRKFVVYFIPKSHFFPRFSLLVSPLPKLDVCEGHIVFFFLSLFATNIRAASDLIKLYRTISDLIVILLRFGYLYRL